MAKTLTLKLIESTEEPQMGDLVKSKRGWIGIFGRHENSYPDECKVVKPYGVSDEEIKIGDHRYSGIQNNVGLANPVDLFSGYYQERSDKYKKVVITPEQFNIQELVDLKLKDGDSFELLRTSDGHYDEKEAWHWKPLLIEGKYVINPKTISVV